MQLMPVYGPDGWRERYGEAIAGSDNGLRYFLTPDVKDELLAAGVIFTISSRMMTDDPERLKEALIEIIKRRSKARALRRISIEQAAPLRPVPTTDDAPA
ncbi:hypothetical protein [Cupriavidus taiwanensis]|uniref:Uncharacterized protein n=1 Tax=Cupriavidus taiwanensis TaxID=164546 RepID=A0A375BWQ9_9BURK|nr:hypothetical protein CBM2587_A80019 [Cupriavidus taiwanensis]